jgi:hypothetical protein
MDIDFKDLEEWENVAARPTGTQHSVAIGGVEVPGFTETCKKCHGTGTFTSYSGRPVGSCFTCKGTGKLQFKTAPEARAKAKTKAAERKAATTATNAAAFGEFLRANPAVKDWLGANGERNDFARSMIAAGAKYGYLTDNQVAAILRGVARDGENEVAWRAEPANAELAAWLDSETTNGNEFAASLLAGVKRYGKLTPNQEAAVRRNIEHGATTSAKAEAKPSDLDVSSLKGYYAVPQGETRLKVRVKHPGKDSRHHGWTFVDDGAAYGHRQNYGRQAPGGKYAGKIQDELRAILADPKAAQIAYGKLTGSCGVCGRILEDADSIAAGIGPVCAGKYR